MVAIKTSETLRNYLTPTQIVSFNTEDKTDAWLEKEEE